MNLKKESKWKNALFILCLSLFIWLLKAKEIKYKKRHKKIKMLIKRIKKKIINNHQSLNSKKKITLQKSNSHKMMDKSKKMKQKKNRNRNKNKNKNKNKENHNKKNQMRVKNKNKSKNKSKNKMKMPIKNRNKNQNKN
jgi:hypothetical protein